MVYTKLERKGLIRYIIFTYLLFWILLGATGLLISVGVPELIQTLMKNVCAWTPTFVLLLMFKNLYPRTNLRDFFKINFLCQTKIRYFLIAFILQSAVYLGAIFVYLAINNLRLESIPLISASALLPALIVTATSGAMGEELGWRAYALNVLQKKYSPLKSALLVGLVWGFWHLPLWILSGFSGLELLYYCFFFLLTIISLSVVITYFYNKGRSVLIAMWIHFLFNLFLQLMIIDMLQLLIYLSVGYFLLALLLVLTYKTELLNKGSENQKYDENK